MDSRWWAHASWVRQAIRIEKVTRTLQPGSIVLAAIGTLADARLADGPLLATFKEGNLDVEVVKTFDGLDELVTDSEWKLAVVLSPFKRQIVRYCDKLSNRATSTGAVDTLVRDGSQIVGYNVNSFAIQRAFDDLSMFRHDECVLVLGAGAVAASTLAAVASINAEADVGVLARSPDRGAELVDRSHIGRVIESAKEFGATLVVHATTVGERDDSEVLEMDIGDVFRPGVRLLDANNRFSDLQRLALESGALVLGGSYLRHANNMLRVALVAGRDD